MQSEQQTHSLGQTEPESFTFHEAHAPPSELTKACIAVTLPQTSEINDALFWR